MNHLNLLLNLASKLEFPIEFLCWKHFSLVISHNFAPINNRHFPVTGDESPAIRLRSLLFPLLLVSPSIAVDINGIGRKKHKIEGPIKTVFVVIMENRSFDHVLGWLKSTRPDIDGLTGKESNRISAADLNPPEVLVSNDVFFVDSDPGHLFQAIHEQILGSNDSFANPAPMNGFAQQAERMGEGMLREGMGSTLVS